MSRRAPVDRDDLDTGLDTELDDELDDDLDTDEVVEPAPLVVRGIGWILAVTGAIGFAASFILTVERFILLSNPDYVPSCSINAAVSCETVMSSAAGALFGFPNPLLGIAGFAIVATSGVAVISGARLAPWFWGGLQVGAALAIVFVHWLMYQSLAVIQALCPYCMVVWTVTITAFWAITLRNLYAVRAARGHPAPADTPVINLAPVWLTVWLGSVATVVIMRIVLG